LRRPKRVFRQPVAVLIKINFPVFIKSVRRGEESAFTERAIKFRRQQSSRTDAEIVAPFGFVAADVEKRQAGAGVEINVVGFRVVDVNADFENRRAAGQRVLFY
jgi:hypothetical protein